MAFVYTSCYCEENVFMLCKDLIEKGDGSELFVVFISNVCKQAPIWCQKKSSDGGFCIWDYHVVCVQKRSLDEAAVWDLDTTLGLPVNFGRYVNEALKPQLIRGSAYERLFRVISAPLFLKHFASDRRHMKRPDGEWLSPPPKYECIVAEDGAVHNLDIHIDMTPELNSFSRKQILDCLLRENLGCVVSEDQFYDLFN